MIARLPLLALLFLSACTAPAPRVAPGQLAVGFVIVDGVYGSELVAPHDIFHHTVFHDDAGMAVFTIAPSRAPVTTFEGLRIIPDVTFDDAPPLDVLVVPSAEGSMDADLRDEALMDYVRRAGAEADWIVSLCDGAFVLAAAGLLDGRASTTFPDDVAHYRETFPQLEVLDGVSFVRDGRAITSAGGARSYDPALWLVETLYGKAAADGVAAGMVIEWDPASIAHVDRGP